MGLPITADEAVSHMLKTFKNNSYPHDIVNSDVLDHYRNYSSLEKYLQTPSMLSEQPTFQLGPDASTLLIQKYYSLDDYVAREILGKKLTSRYRKDLDEVADKTGVRLKSCRRQFDNIKRIYKAVEEVPGNVSHNIKQTFLLSDELARKYATIVFINCIRFETGKRKLQYLHFSDFYECALSIMSFWTYTYQHSGPEYNDTEMDKEYLLDLRELRSLLDKEREIKVYVEYKNIIRIIFNLLFHIVILYNHNLLNSFSRILLIRLKPQVLERHYQELDLNFRSYWRSLITIACNLHRTRELRGIFLELSEKLLDPWRQNNWSADQVQLFLQVITQSVLDMEVSR